MDFKGIFCKIWYIVSNRFGKGEGYSDTENGDGIKPSPQTVEKASTEGGEAAAQKVRPPFKGVTEQSSV